VSECLIYIPVFTCLSCICLNVLFTSLYSRVSVLYLSECLIYIPVFTCLCLVFEGVISFIVHETIKRSGACIDDMLHFVFHFLKTVIRSVLEYACPVWHNSLTNEQSDQLECIQKRALKIICGSSFIDYEHMCFLYNLPSLSEHRETICKRFFFKNLC